jgi:hypothetical protein
VLLHHLIISPHSHIHAEYKPAYAANDLENSSISLLIYLTDKTTPVYPAAPYAVARSDDLV